MKEPTQGGKMDASQIAEIIRKRLKLEDDDWSMIEKNPKFQKLFQNAKDRTLLFKDKDKDKKIGHCFFRAHQAKMVS
jgi:hypothetical protein